MPELANEKKCTGCTACYSICTKNCITMQEDKYGFPYPRIDSTKCIECKLCETVCPVLHNSTGQLSEHTVIYAAYSKDTEMRLESSSGGIVTEIARVILSREGLVAGAAYTKEFSVKHICVSSEDKLNTLCGAKYTQSNLNNIFQNIKTALQDKKEVLFIGTPCQVAGLKNFLQISYDTLYTIDFVCHGVPSPMAWKSYVNFRADRDNAGEYPKKINLRSKHTGWSRYQYSNLYEYSNGKKYSAKSGNDLFMKLFVGDYINREACGNCHFKGVERISDFTVGDFWGIWDILPDLDDNKGTSVVAVHTEVAKKIFREISGKIKYKKIDVTYAFKQNPSMLYSSIPSSKRSEILDLITEAKFNQVEEILQKSQTRSVIVRIQEKMIKLLFRIRAEISRKK